MGDAFSVPFILSCNARIRDHHWVSTPGAYVGMEQDLLTFAANFYPWMAGSGSLKHFCSIFSWERPAGFVMHQAAKTKGSKMAGILAEGGSRVKSRKVQNCLSG